MNRRAITVPLTTQGSYEHIWCSHEALGAWKPQHVNCCSQILTPGKSGNQVLWLIIMFGLRQEVITGAEQQLVA